MSHSTAENQQSDAIYQAILGMEQNQKMIEHLDAEGDWGPTSSEHLSSLSAPLHPRSKPPASYYACGQGVRS